jgi:O-antigen/teichoic acid export membrane protein
MKAGVLNENAGLIFILLAKSSGAIFSVLITYIVMNYYSGDAAEFFLIFSAVNITSYICRFGSDNYLLRADPSGTEFYSEVSSLYACSLLASIFIGAVVVLFSQDYILSSIFIVVNLCFTISQINARYYAARMMGAMSAFVMNSASLAVLVFLTAVDIVYFNFDFRYSLLWGWCFSVIFVSLVSLPVRNLKTFSGKSALNVIGGSRVFFVSGILNLTIYWGGQVISGFSLTENELNALAFSQRVSGIMGLLSLASSIYMSPRVARFFQSGDIENLGGIVKQCNLFVSSASVFALLLSFLLYESILDIFNVDKMYAWLFLFTICSQSIFCVLSNSLQLLNMTNNEALTRRSVLCGFSVFIALSAFAYIFKSIIVMAIAVNLSLIVQGVIAAYYVKRKLALSPWSFVLK